MALPNSLAVLKKHLRKKASILIMENFTALDERITNTEAGVVAEGSIGSDEIANGAVIEGKLGTGAVTSGKVGTGAITEAKIGAGAVTPAKLFDNYIDSAGITIEALTAAIADPATLVDGTQYVIKDTSDSNKIKPIIVAGSVFLVGAALTAAEAAG
jgi:hypothetical protein